MSLVAEIVVKQKQKVESLFLHQIADLSYTVSIRKASEV